MIITIIIIKYSHYTSVQGILVQYSCQQGLSFLGQMPKNIIKYMGGVDINDQNDGVRLKSRKYNI